MTRDVTPDPKSGKRIVDDAARRMFLVSHRACAACGSPSSNVHHVVQKGSPHFGDDVPGNFLAICGTGTMRCHGAIHGSPYEVEVGSLWVGEPPDPPERKLVERRDTLWVAQRLGVAILGRPDIIKYVLDRIGSVAGLAFLERFYFVAPALAQSAAGIPYEAF